MTESSGIYCIKNKINGKVYVGSAANISKRWSRHRKDLREGKHRNKHLQASVNKHGLHGFDFVVLEFTSALDSREQHWMDRLLAVERGYNKCPTARSSRGRKWSAEERKARCDSGQFELMQRLAQQPSVKRRRANTRRADRTLGQKITWPIAKQIRAAYLPRKTTLAFLGSKYGIHPVTVFDVVHGKTWRTPP